MKGRLAIDFEWRDAALWMDSIEIVRLVNISDTMIYVYSSYPGYQSHHTSPAVVYRYVPMDVINCMLAKIGS